MAVQWATPGFDEVALGIQLSYVISAVSFLKPLYWLATLFLPLTLCKRWGESVVRRAITLLTYVLNLEPEVRDGVKYNWVMDTEMESLVFVEKRAAGKQRLWVAFTGSTSFYDWSALFSPPSLHRTATAGTRPPFSHYCTLGSAGCSYSGSVDDQILL